MIQAAHKEKGMTNEAQLEKLRNSLPFKGIKVLVLVEEDGSKEIGLEIYSSPFLIYDRIKTTNTYIKQLGLDLVAKKSGIDSFVVELKLEKPA